MFINRWKLIIINVSSFGNTSPWLAVLLILKSWVSLYFSESGSASASMTDKEVVVAIGIRFFSYLSCAVRTILDYLAKVYTI